MGKFASLPWTASTGILLGGADRHGPAGFYGAEEPGLGQRLPAPLAPPDLVILDELHLTSGPLRTMVGLYEATIEALCTRPATDSNRVVLPKIVASMATVRQAGDQTQALFARPETRSFRRRVRTGTTRSLREPHRSRRSLGVYTSG